MFIVGPVLISGGVFSGNVLPEEVMKKRPKSCEMRNRLAVGTTALSRKGRREKMQVTN